MSSSELARTEAIIICVNLIIFPLDLQNGASNMDASRRTAWCVRLHTWTVSIAVTTARVTAEFVAALIKNLTLASNVTTQLCDKNNNNYAHHPSSLVISIGFKCLKLLTVGRIPAFKVYECPQCKASLQFDFVSNNDKPNHKMHVPQLLPVNIFLAINVLQLCNYSSSCP